MAVLESLFQAEGDFGPAIGFFNTIGPKPKSLGRYVITQTAEVAASRELFREILRMIDALRAIPTVA